MPWNLTEEEQDAIMNAVKAVLNPHLEKATGSFKIFWEDGSEEPLEVPHVGFVISKNAPAEIKLLDDAFQSIIAKGAVIGGPFLEETS